MDRQTFLASKIEELLNLHSTFRFKVRDHVANLDEFYDDMVQGFREESPYFWSLLTDYTGEYIPIKDSNSTNESCSLYLHIPDLFIDEVMPWLKTTFASLVVANEFEDANGIKNLMTMNIPTLFDVRIRNGIEYAIVYISFAFRSSAKYTFGSEVKIYLNDVEVVPYDGRQITQVKSNLPLQFLGENIVTSSTIGNALNFSLTFYYEPIEPFQSLLKEVTQGEINNIYRLRFTLPEKFDFTHNVILENGSVSFPLGNFTILTCLFSLAAEAE